MSLALRITCDNDGKTFLNSSCSNVVGYFPILGTPVGVARVVFNILQLCTALNAEQRSKAFYQIGRGVVEAFSLGLLNAIYDLFLRKILSRLILPNPYLQHFAITPSSASSIDHHLGFLTAYSSKHAHKASSLYSNYRSYGEHAWRDQALFSGADFFTRHGIMHASCVALFVPLFASLYRDLGFSNISSNSEELKDLQIIAFFHDFGRFETGHDLGSDHGEIEEKGAIACSAYLQNARGYSKGKANRLAQMILRKDYPLSFKSWSEEILQNCDSLAVLRADDWKFDERFLNIRSRIDQKITDPIRKAQALEKLHRVIDEAKQFLIALGDSPYDMPAVSEMYRGQVFKGNFSLNRKSHFEKNAHCYSLMKTEMHRYPTLSTAL